MEHTLALWLVPIDDQVVTVEIPIIPRGAIYLGVNEAGRRSIALDVPGCPWCRRAAYIDDEFRTPGDGERVQVYPGLWLIGKGQRVDVRPMNRHIGWTSKESIRRIEALLAAL